MPCLCLKTQAGHFSFSTIPNQAVVQNAVLFLERRFRRSAVDELLIQTNVIVCGAAPTVVTRHCALHKHLPAVLALVVRVDRAVHGVQHILRVIRLEREAVALAVAAVRNGVLQAARFAYDRNGTIAQRHHL